VAADRSSAKESVVVDRRRFIAGSGAVGTRAVLGTTSACTAEAEGEAVSGTAPAAGHIRSATAITQVYGDGQKLIAVAVEYDTDITGSALSTSTFKVTGRTVTKVYANRTADLAEHGRDGRYVVVEMSPDDKAEAVRRSVTARRAEPSSPRRPPSPRPATSPPPPAPATPRAARS
jgi:hypothetical protein